MGGAVVVDAGAGADIAGGVGAAAAAAGGACDDGGGGGVDDPQPMTMQVPKLTVQRQIPTGGVDFTMAMYEFLKIISGG